jgi:hypothetical protein
MEYDTLAWNQWVNALYIVGPVLTAENALYIVGYPSMYFGTEVQVSDQGHNLSGAVCTGMYWYVLVCTGMYLN